MEETGRKGKKRKETGRNMKIWEETGRYPKVSKKYSKNIQKDIFEVSPKYLKSILKLSQKYPKSMPKGSKNYPKSIYKVSQKYPKSIPQVSQKYHNNALRSTALHCTALHFSVLRCFITCNFFEQQGDSGSIGNGPFFLVKMWKCGLEYNYIVFGHWVPMLMMYSILNKFDFETRAQNFIFLLSQCPGTMQ